MSELEEDNVYADIAKLAKERDELRQQMTTLTKERDEARAQLKERDEARAAWLVRIAESHGCRLPTRDSEEARGE